MRRFMLGAMALLVCVGVANAGISYKAITRAKDARGREQTASVMNAVVDGQKARIDFESRQGGGVPDGGYLITRDGGRIIYMVNPKEKTYMEWDVDKLAGMANSIMQNSGGMLNMTVTNHKSEKLLDEKGPKLLGYPTRHYKFSTSYSMEMSVMGFKQKSDVETEQEIWAGQKLGDDAFSLWNRITSFKTGLEDVDKLIAAETGKVKGFPLKTVVISRTTDKKGRTQTTESTTEITEIKKLTPAGSLFEIPEGYREERLEIPTDETGDGDDDDDIKPSTPNDAAASVNKFLRSFGRKRK